MNQILNNTTQARSNKSVKGVILIVLACAIVCLSVLFSIMNIGNEKIINNVFIAGVEVSNMTKDEAIEAVNGAVDIYFDRNLSFSLDDKEYSDVSAKELGFVILNLEEAIEEAYNYGRDSNFILNNYTILFSNFINKEIELQYDLEEEQFSEFAQKIANDNESISLDDTYEISGEKIIVTKGQDGLKVDEELLENYVITAILNNVAEVEIPTLYTSSENIDFDALHDEVYVAPQNASFVSGEKFEVIIDKTGVDFDVELAKQKYEDLNELDSMTLELRIVEPEIKVADLDEQLFKDTLATYSTKYDTTEKNRVQNLQVASDRCNSTIIYPGNEFSFHETIGTRTIANGYASAHSFAGGRVVNTVGGGICQISSMLYNIVLMADLEVTERVAHGMYVDYVKPSLDATIAEGAIDFKFVNNRNYPIKIVSTLNNGTVTMSILGIKEEDDPIIELESVVLETLKYETEYQYDSNMLVGKSVELQEPEDGYLSEAYRIEKDENGNVISRTLISKDKYIPTNRIVKIGTKEPTPVVPEVPEVPEEPDVSEPEPDEPIRDLPPGWDSPESPYGG